MTAAIYCRLSKEDEDRHLESESIQNQKALLIKYAFEQGWDIYQIYCDEDYSGADRTRPAFLQLLSDARARKFDLVLVKTQSRFTRDLELVEKYIHGLFPLWGVRFVSVVDHIDTDLKGNKKARQINGLINEWYLEDLSENIRAVLDYKRRAGQYIGGFPVYGYQKDPKDKNKLLIDPGAAEVVQKIYSLFLSGSGKQQIAVLLNREGVPNPTRYKQLQGLGYVNGAQVNGLGLWSRTSVGRILRERMYTGDLVQGRRKKASYKSKKLLSIPEEDWIVVPGAHEAIIDKDTFCTVQALLRQRTKTSGCGEAHPLAGKVRCMDCGSAMVKVSNTYRGERRSYLRCKLYAAAGLCDSHSVRLDVLEAQVLSLLAKYMEAYYDPGRAGALRAHSGTAQKKAALEREIRHLALEAEQRGKALRDLYLDKSRGLLDEQQFQELNQGYLVERAALQARLRALTAEQDALNQRESSRDLQDRPDPALIPGQLTRDLAACFIDTVEVGQRDPETGRQPLRIHWLF